MFNLIRKLTGGDNLKDVVLPRSRTLLRAGRGMFAAVVEFKRFASFRNRIGYANANGLLNDLSKALEELPEMTMGRLGRTSIEFVFSARSDEHAEELMESMLHELSKPISFRGIEYDPQPVVGLCKVEDTALTDFHFDKACKAISIAVRSSQQLRFANENVIVEEKQDQLDLLYDLQKAIEQEELTLAYMPKLNLRNGQIESAECLCRWNHPLRGPISPEDFIAMVDESGMMDRLTLWIAERVIEDQRMLAANGIDIQLDLNLSASLVSNVVFCTQLIELVTKASGRIGIEITETAVIEQPDVAIKNLEAFVRAGAWLAIDDYGSGLSSLTYLRRIPAHEMKIDKSFITDITKSNRDPLLVRSSIELAHSLEMLITAEGVEDDMTLSLLQAMGCDTIQGFWLSKAIPVEEFATFYREFTSENRWQKSRIKDSPGQFSQAVNS